MSSVAVKLYSVFFIFLLKHRLHSCFQGPWDENGTSISSSSTNPFGVTSRRMAAIQRSPLARNTKVFIEAKKRETPSTLKADRKKRKKEMEGEKHFILVHGACHGAWSWYKVATLLRSAGHRVTPIDLAASGINLKTLDVEVSTFANYTQPLLDALASLPQDERVILVGHSLGGLNMALAMDQFPEKVAVGVFMTAFMPDSRNSPSYVLDQYFERIPLENFLDTHFAFNRGPGKPSTMLFGPKFIEKKLYQLSPPEDLTLAMTLVRVGSLFREDLSITPIFSQDRYGSVNRVYILCDQDLGIPQHFQRWMIENYPVKEVKEIKGADHMAMFCKPQELCKYLLEIAETYQ